MLVGKQGVERNPSFESQGDGIGTLGQRSQDEFWREQAGLVGLTTTTTSSADLLRSKACR